MTENLAGRGEGLAGLRHERTYWLIYFDEDGRQPEFFTDEGVARERLKKKRGRCRAISKSGEECCGGIGHKSDHFYFISCTRDGQERITWKRKQPLMRGAGGSTKS